jgi:hypothetical protein
VFDLSENNCGVETLGLLCNGSATVCQSVRDSVAQYLQKELGA